MMLRQFQQLRILPNSYIDIEKELTVWDTRYVYPRRLVREAPHFLERLKPLR